jgi:hypothetical protein
MRRPPHKDLPGFFLPAKRRFVDKVYGSANRGDLPRRAATRRTPASLPLRNLDQWNGPGKGIEHER